MSTRLERLEARARNWRGVTADIQWSNDLVFKVAGKMFLVFSRDGATVESLSFKVTSEDFVRLPDESDALRPAPYLARASWLQLTDPAALSDAELTHLVERSYQLVRTSLPQKLQATLG